MKRMKKLLLSVFAVMMAMGCVLEAGSVSVEAASKAEVPKIVRTGYGPAYVDEYAFDVKLAAVGDTIKNVKTNSKNISGCVTYFGESSGDVPVYTIGLRVQKKGTYKVSFEIYNSKGKLKSQKTVTVKAIGYANPVKSITLNGKTYNGTFLPKSLKKATLKITMNKGYKLKSVRVGVYKKTKDGNSTEQKYVAAKNNSKITLGTLPYMYENKYGSLGESYYSHNWRKGMTAPTYIEITYYDSATKANDMTTRSFEKYLG